ncbi:serine hydrolase [Streptomyces sp. NPDC002055]|uniref:serine hydrolase n=1 Tax=Streptomyces sp. NPDC002055 TaxID=3154534 RepID=UPI003332CC0D
MENSPISPRFWLGWLPAPPVLGSRPRRVLAAIAAAGSALTVLATAAPAGATTARASAGGAEVVCSSRQPGLALRLSRDLAHRLHGRPGTSAVAFYDRPTATSCSYNAEAAFDSASVVKVTVLGALLRQAMERRYPLTAEEVRLTTAMITESDNASTSELWRRIGPDGIRHFLELAGLRHTVPGADGHWGLTRITAGDQLRLLRLLTSENPVLDRPARAYALGLMRRVVPEQRWGVPAGAPGTAAVQLKNGWLPRSTGGWRVHSIGAFTGDGHDRGMVVLSQGNPAMDDGIATVEGAARALHDGLAGSG